MRKTFITMALLVVALSVSTQHNMRLRENGTTFDLCNITDEEFADIAVIDLAWYGYYAGSNTLGMVKFAEHFDLPESPVKINSVKLYFGKSHAAFPDNQITVSICTPDGDGMPGESIASTAKRTGNIVPDDGTKPATEFFFAEPVSIGSDFFVVIEGLTCAKNYDTMDVDEMALYCYRRSEDGLCTSYHMLEDPNFDADDPPFIYTWYKNVDDPLSIAVAVNVTQEGTNDIKNVGEGDNGKASSGTETHYSADGKRIDASHRGMQIIRNSNGSVRKVMAK